MPSDVLNVRQISGYPNLGIQATDNALIQRGGIGGPYLSVSAQQFVGQALAAGGPMSVGNQAPADTEAPQLFTDGLSMVLEGQLMWNCYVGGGQEKMVGPGPGGRIVVGLDGSMVFQYAAPTGSGTVADFTTTLDIDPTGYLTVGNQMLLARDPAGPLEAATAQFVENVVAGVRAASVWSFMGRTGDVRLWIQDILAAGGAPQFSPVFGGEPRAPTPAPNSCNSRLATTAFVQRCVIMALDSFAANTPLVTSFNGRFGAVTLTAADIEAAGATTFAPLDSAQLTGVPTAPTASPGSSTGQLATTAFVMAAITAATAGVASFNTRTGAVVLQGTDITGAGGALLVSPVFTGTPQAPTAPPGTSTAQLATTAFVMNELGGSNLGVVSFNGRDGAVTLNSTDITNAGGATTAFVTSAVAAAVVSFNGRTGAVTLSANDLSAVGGAPLASPAFTGTPTAPTASPGTNTQQLATTAFVTSALAGGAGVTTFNGRAGAVTLTNADVIAVLPAYTALPGMDGTAAAGVANSWSRGDHIHPTDTSRYAASNPSGFQTAAQVASALAAYAPLAGATFTGGIAAPAMTCTGTLGVSTITQTGGSVSFSATSMALLGAAATNIFWDVYIGATLQGRFGWNNSLNAVTMANNVTGDEAYLASNNAFVVGPIPTGAFKPGGGAWSSSSDARIKNVWNDYEQGLDAIVQLTPVVYSYKGNDAPPGTRSVTGSTGKRFIGLVAQSAETAMPEMVTKRPGFIDGKPVEDFRDLDPTPLIFALINAVKTLAARVAALEAA